jgi:hypothetical protein
MIWLKVQGRDFILKKNLKIEKERLNRQRQWSAIHF